MSVTDKSLPIFGLSQYNPKCLNQSNKTSKRQRGYKQEKKMIANALLILH